MNLAKGEEKMPYCPKCGSYVSEEASFCPSCGTKLIAPPAPPTQPPYAPPPTAVIPFFTKLVRAAKLDSELYEAVEHDPTALKHAILAITLVNVFSGIGAGLLSFLLTQEVLLIELGLHILIALIRWVILTGIIYLIGVKIFRGTADFAEVARTIAFAYAPVCLQILLPLGILFFPWLAVLILLGTNVWLIMALVIAVRQSLDFTTGKAFGIVVVGGILYIIISLILF